MSYRVATPVFEGPLEVLVRLVNSHQLDVVEIPLAPVVEAFVAELHERRDTLELSVASEFLLYGSILVQVKSEALLPHPEAVEEDEELLGLDSRDALLARLLECQAYAAAAEVFSDLMERASRSLPREAGLDADFVVHAPDLLSGVNAAQLADAYRRATADRPVPEVDLSHVTVDTVTVSEAVVDLAARLPGLPATTFKELTAGAATRIEVIVCFLALLELCKLGRVALGQGATFGDLQVRWLGGELDLDAGEGPTFDDYRG